MITRLQESDYGVYIEQDFRYRWLRPQYLYEKLEKFKAHSHLKIETIGKSVEDRDINSISWGHGPAKILCWTQMHGNEPTATMAVIDLLNFFTATDKYDQLRLKLKERIEVKLILMLNPDGAEVFSRRTALNIDMNRDAVSFKTPEMQLLVKQVKYFQPNWAFNLHDQRNIFSAGNTNKTATLSFLAASADEEKTITPARTKSMKLIGLMAERIEESLAGHIGRYTDEYYPRALGEYFHRQEIPCVLIESGMYPGDVYRDMARKYNFLGLLHAFQLIANDEYKQADLTLYHNIPQNHTNILDLVIRDCKLLYEDKTIPADLGFLYRDSPDFENNKLERHLHLVDVGDLSFHTGLQEEDGGEVDFTKGSFELEKRANITIRRKKQTDIILKNGKRQ